ncbi:AFR210Cp [Eremothecium gossypii ATCC 10895]|uniref:AFR210Cp n=1 Tax=Eremothecium gossypii (strain ATCC 10895 / CBS 109.51 / FGSC 9923 / NRRL Y-1056) TaxID=284811 RepID=Q753W2_EREGS|nr:AFR210Cp [Eremothecium gossypii ATCC 10895]AAS53581.2 AFR210Cp [Eremothecium gossypii ATCC 10895]AEY97894.1 FAFR210Cp [Eremothecium gossypii FDAG1]
MMDIKDRTIEFQRSVTSYSRRNAKQGAGGPGEGADRQSLRKSEFQQRASRISHEIANLAQMLSKLAQLAKRKPMFNDNPVEIAEMTYLIKHKIYSVEQEMMELSRHMPNNGGGVADGGAQTRLHTKNVVNLLNTKMKNISGDFKSVLEARQKLELANRDRWEKISADRNSAAAASLQDGLPMGGMGVSSGSAAAYNSANPFMSSLLAEDDASGQPNGQLSLPNEESVLLLEEQQTANQQYLQERGRAVETIESTIQEVGNLFQQLAHMVQEQGETIQRIDANVEDIDINIAGAQRELLKYFDRISSNRWMAVKIFAILFAFFLVWVIVN